MFTGIGAIEILLIAAALLLLFGARRIPEIARGLGAGIRNFKGSLHDAGSGERTEVPPEPGAEHPGEGEDPAREEGDAGGERSGG